MLSFADARFRCTQCGDCCRGEDVPLLPGEAERFMALVPAGRIALGRADLIPASAGACPALEPDARCAIHVAHGPTEKPRACRVFPYTFVATPTEVRVGVSFACPAVMDGEGPLLVEQRADVEAVWMEAARGTSLATGVPDQVLLDDDVSVPWRQAQVLLDELAGALDGPGRLDQQLCRAGALLTITLEELAGGLGFPDAVEVARAGVERAAAARLAKPPLVDRLSRAMLRTLVQVTEPASSAAGRVRAAVSSLLGGGALRLREPMMEVPWRAVSAVKPGIGEGAALIRRWLSVALNSLTFFGEPAFGLSVAAGLELLTLEAATVAVLARAQAAAVGRDGVVLDDCKRALRQLDRGIAELDDLPRSFALTLHDTAAVDLLRQIL